jgi:DNA helicase-2/ATP-dependent DNA helicase PcrA
MESHGEIAATQVAGGVGTGKTQYLIDRVASLIAAGAEPSDILVLCASPLAATTFERRLEAAGISGATVTTARGIALDILAEREAVDAMGRDPRVLSTFETSFVMEDMKVSGVKPKRLREMLKFFYRSWTELAEEQDDWLVTVEEEEVHRRLKNILASLRGYLECEVACYAVKVLRDLPVVRMAHARGHVMFDDFQCASRASQYMAGLLARKTYTITGDANAVTEVYDSYPYAAGLTEFLEMYPQATCVRLTTFHRGKASLDAVKHLLADPALDPCPLTHADTAGTHPHESLEVYAAATPAEEIAEISEMTAQAVRDGVPASHIAIATPSDIWSRNVVGSLASHGIRAQALPDREPIRGDIRDNARCVPARVLTMLNLLADPSDALAWRCWCGFGDHLANSNGFDVLYAISRNRQMGLVDALRTVSERGVGFSDAEYEREHAASVQRIVQAYRTGCSIMARLTDLSGAALLDRITSEVTDGAIAQAPGTVKRLCLADEGDESPAAMARRARQRLLAPTLTNDGVMVVPYRKFAGLSPDLLIISGFVNGSIPTRDYFDSSKTVLDKRQRVHAADTRSVYTLAGKAGERLAVTFFTSIGIEDAYRLKLKIDRIYVPRGTRKRVCSIAPSDFLEAMTAEG